MSHALEQFQKTRTYHIQAPAAQILQDLSELHSFDKSQESDAKKFGCIGGLMIPLAMAAIPVTFWNIYVGLPLLLLGVGAAIYLLSRAYKAHKQNIEDRRYLLLQSIVDLLSRDVAADTTFNVTLALRPIDSRDNFQTKGKTGHWNYKLYAEMWLQLEVKLLDGTACRIQLTEKCQNRHRWKRSASGKSKLKQKKKSALEVAVRLKPKTRRYSKLGEIKEDAAAAVQLPDWGLLKSIAVEEGGLMLKAATKSEWDAPRKGQRGQGPHGVHLVAMMMLSLYQILNLSRAVTKAQKEDS